MSNRLWVIVCALLLSVFAFAEDPVAKLPTTAKLPGDTSTAAKPKDPIYYGTQLKLDLLSPAVVAGMSKGLLQQYEMAVNVRLAKRFYPTLEAGYAGGSTNQGDTIFYTGHGGFFRFGVDINPLKKHPDSPHALLIGLRIGSGFQPHKADCWGEIVAGCQVEIAKGKQTTIDKQPMAFYMGWMGRFKFLFTRATEDKNGNLYPIYIPGYGNRDNIGWGVNYYLGWRF